MVISMLENHEKPLNERSVVCLLFAYDEFFVDDVKIRKKD
jgi:hypothetical protein